MQLVSLAAFLAPRMSLWYVLLFGLVDCFGFTTPFGRSRGTAPLLKCSSAAIAEVCTQAAREAGRVILEGSRKVNLLGQVTSKQGSRDILTEYDVRSQRVIKDVIASVFPSHAFLGEEDVEPGRDSSIMALEKVSREDHLWIVDPIDGTTNFAQGQPLAGVIIAYAQKGVVQFGCIYDPFMDEMFTAWRGGGAYLNGSPISCCATNELKDSVICTGSPPNIDSLNACLRATNLISSEVRTMRMLGSAAIMLAWVACGRLTAYFEADMNCWDTQAGALIVQEAGGRVSNVFGDEFILTSRNLVASNGKIHDVLTSRLKVSKMWI